MAGVTTSFSLTVVAITIFVVVRHPSGPIVYVCAALATIPAFFMLGMTSVLIKSEKDEFKRVILVRSLLWAIAGTLAMSLFTGYLREFGAAVKLPPWAELVAFVLMFGLARVAYVFRNRVKSHD
jgi:Kef-type K+ transport system membrane component KefB